ncbi:hypothetical protein [Companilactobacillus ginsenosidimutans]|uniref:Uncharacterized protein n=1 Tax=Companilactobacillus ginsenosidimutans TaxID=1007676 RepID=A0A0H4QH14_9LACO|nr:hypothetical protein [Companilactobacillus ginsenosidimutans]AKP67232.1 hypothetical protein ABM34_06565 [Companilactobacillus ginsenosidimutans]
MSFFDRNKKSADNGGNHLENSEDTTQVNNNQFSSVPPYPQQSATSATAAPIQPDPQVDPNVAQNVSSNTDQSVDAHAAFNSESHITDNVPDPQNSVTPETHPADNNFSQNTSVQPDGPELNGYYYEEQPVPEKDNNDWVSTEEDLQGIINQENDVKKQLRYQLLSARSYYNYVLRSLGNDQENARTETNSQVEKINTSLKKWFDTDDMANEIFLDPNRNYFIFHDHLEVNPDDGERQMWRKLTKTFDNHGFLANTITVSYDDLANQTWTDYQNSDLVNPNSYLLNMYNDLQGRNNNVAVSPAEIPFEENYRIEHDTDKNIDKVYDEDNLIMEVARNNRGQLKVIRHYDKDKLLSRDIFDVNGVNSATQFYDPQNPNRVVRENFYRQDGTLVMIKSYTDSEPFIQLFSQGNVLISTFKNDEELIFWWLKNQALRNMQATIFVSIDSIFYKKLLELRKYSVEIIPIIMTQDQNAGIVTDLLNGTDKVTAVFAGNDNVNGYLNKNAKVKMDISTLEDVETPIYKH